MESPNAPISVGDQISSIFPWNQTLQQTRGTSVARDQLQDLAERNPPIRLITRIAFGFKSPDALIALATLSLGDTNQPSPARINQRIWQESPVFCVFRDCSL